MLILEQFLYGNVSPGERRYHPREEYNKPFRVMEKCEEVLKAELSPAGWAAFKDYAETSSKAYGLEVSDSFIDGFRMGVLMMLDVLHPTQDKKEGQI